MHLGVRCIVTFVIHWLLCSTVRLWINATDLGTQCARCFTGSNRRVGRSQEPQIWHRGIRSNSPLSLADSGPRLGPCEAQQWDKGRRNPLRGLRRRLGWSVRWPGQAWPWQQYFNIASCDCDRCLQDATLINEERRWRKFGGSCCQRNAGDLNLAPVAFVGSVQYGLKSDLYFSDGHHMQRQRIQRIGTSRGRCFGCLLHRSASTSLGKHLVILTRHISSKSWNSGLKRPRARWIWMLLQNVVCSFCWIMVQLTWQVILKLPKGGWVACAQTWRCGQLDEEDDWWGVRVVSVPRWWSRC